MSRLRHPSVVLLAGALALGIIAAPAVASADDTTGTTVTQLTPTEVLADLAPVQTATTAAEHPGWTQWINYTDKTGASDRAQVVYDRSTRRSSLTDPLAHQEIIEISHRGSYQTLAGSGNAKRLKRILDMIGRPDATWVYEADPTINLEGGPFALSNEAPHTLITELGDNTSTTITGTSTETTTADGVSTFVVPITTIDNPASTTGKPVLVNGQVTLTVAANKELTAADLSLSDENEAKTFTYGPQQIDLPAPAQVARAAQIDQARALLHMAADAKQIAEITAEDVVKSPHQNWGPVRLIRTAARQLVKETNRRDWARVFTTRTLPRGIRITATNRFTHETINYTVKSAGKGKMAIIRRG